MFISEGVIRFIVCPLYFVQLYSNSNYEKYLEKHGHTQNACHIIECIMRM